MFVMILARWKILVDVKFLFGYKFVIRKLFLRGWMNRIKIWFYSTTMFSLCMLIFWWKSGFIFTHIHQLVLEIIQALVISNDWYQSWFKI